MRRYKEMMAVVSDAKNHSAYRQALIKARPPVVPYLGKASFLSLSLSLFISSSHRALTTSCVPITALFSKDLFGVEESNATITSDGLINFGKMRLIARL